MNKQQETKQSHFFSKFIMWIVVLIAIYTITGFLIIPAIVKSVLPQKLSDQLNREVIIEAINFNPFELSINLFGVSIKQSTGPESLLAFKELYADVQIKSVMEKTLIIREVRLKDPVINITRNKNGDFNFSDLMAKKTETQTSSPESKPFIFQIGKLGISSGRISFKDSSFEKPVQTSLNKINFAAEKISNKTDSKFDISLSLEVNDKGSISVKGPVVIDPVSMDLNLVLSDVDIVSLQPYFSEQIHFLITSGTIDTKGNISHSNSDSGEAYTDFTGEFLLSDFSTVDKLNSEDFLKLNTFNVKGINVHANPLSVNIEEIILYDFYTRLIINQDSSLNITGGSESKKVAENGPETEEASDGSGSGQDNPPDLIVKIDTIALQTGTISFLDRSIDPNYSADLNDIEGTITGISNEQDSVADISLNALLEGSGKLEIKGKTSLLRTDPFVDLKIDFKDIDLSPFTPYSGKYIGYKIQKGKLTLDLEYLMENKILDSKNNIFLDQFTLGEQVESKDAVKLPVKLAVSLLKNRKGEISLDMPVKGKTDDPEFRIGSVIVKLFMNILKKAATSPFSLLGALVGGGEELSYIDFAHGESIIREQEKSKLDKLIKALSDRPSLKVDIEGFIDQTKDGEKLKLFKLQKKIKALKLHDMVAKGETVAETDNIVLSPDEYSLYLTRIYKEDNESPGKKQAKEEEKTSSEMEMFLISNINIYSDEFRTLASQRALTVKQHFTESGLIDAERVFLIEPKTNQDGGKGKEESRVEFRLK